MTKYWILKKKINELCTNLYGDLSVDFNERTDAEITHIDNSYCDITNYDALKRHWSVVCHVVFARINCPAQIRPK